MLSPDELAHAAAHEDDASTRRTYLLALLLRRCAIDCREIADQPGIIPRASADLVSIALDLDELADSYEHEVRPDPKGAWS
jgi:hypothetical protein